MENKVTIRKAKLDELDSISRLNSLLMKHHIVIDKYWGTKKDARQIFSKYARKTIRSPKAAIFVADNGIGLVGYVLGKVDKRSPIFKVEKIGYLSDAYVLRRYRRRGVARMLTEELFKWFRSKGIGYVELAVDIRNPEGIKAWKRLGLEGYLLTMKRKL